MDLSIRGLDELMALIRKAGYRALVIIDQGGTRSPYVGATMDGQGKMQNQTYDTHSTPTLALAQLAVKLGGPTACPDLQVLNTTPTPATVLLNIHSLLQAAGIVVDAEKLVDGVLQLKDRAMKADMMAADAAAKMAHEEAGKE